MDKKQAMDNLRKILRERKLTYATVAQSAKVSPGWVGEVLRGNYPSYRGYGLPKNIRQALQAYNVEIPEILR